ncbi:MAG: AzlD domain-containing protein [Thalassobaculum sp.]|uniref:AzlD family protein n=1 Tax=Thalassobaculum sp. TaxID=2022740 RepID=UPI0032ED9654
MTGDAHTITAILVMALVTYLTRVGGFWLMSLVPEGGFVRRWLHHLPGAVVIAILAPMALDGGWAAPLAIAAAVTMGMLRLSSLIAIFGAVALVAVLRQVI